MAIAPMRTPSIASPRAAPALHRRPTRRVPAPCRAKAAAAARQVASIFVPDISQADGAAATAALAAAKAMGLGELAARAAAEAGLCFGLAWLAVAALRRVVHAAEKV